MDPFKTSSYSFVLPSELIAAEPLRERDQARLLVVNRKSKTLEHKLISDLPALLPTGTVVVANNTQVFKARLLGEREGTGGKIEFFLLRREGPRIWEGLMKAGGKINPGFRFRIPSPQGDFILGEVRSRKESSSGATFVAEFSDDPVERDLGEVPLPPYIVQRRETLGLQSLNGEELSTYNTLFGSQSGSVAAPTAGRHFTHELIQKLKNHGISWEEITLHVGIGTFKPVMTADIRDHEMHEEWTRIESSVAERIAEAKNQGRKILAVGTTTARTLEARSQMSEGRFTLESGSKPVNIFIHPGAGHPWTAVDWMLTNFHLPESTLLMMVGALMGSLEFTLFAYQEAIRERYRFYSYGDAMLICDR